MTADGQDILKRIMDTLDEIPQLARTATEKENAYEIAYASAIIETEGTVEYKKATATRKTADEWLAYQHAKNASRIAEQSAFNVLPKVLSYFQTLAKAEREIAERLTSGR